MVSFQGILIHSREILRGIEDFMESLGGIENFMENFGLKIEEFEFIIEWFKINSKDFWGESFEIKLKKRDFCNYRFSQFFFSFKRPLTLE